MGHPVQENKTQYELLPLFVSDEDGIGVLACIVKGAFVLSSSGALEALAEPAPVDLAGTRNGPEEDSSYKYEPEVAFVKPATDVVLIGHAHAPSPGARVVDVGVKVGPVQKIVRVFGDRFWVKQGRDVVATRPQLFERMPLVYERAYGGWDKADPDERQWRFDPRNPVGRGFGDPLRMVGEGSLPMPNLEDPHHPIKRYGDVPPPAGFGFVSPDWQPRARYAGTYDEAWEKERKPLLPRDFDRRFFNAASPGLVAPGYLRGDEDVVVVNASPTPQLRFKLPGVPPPECSIELRRGGTSVLRTNLDTVIINTDENLVFLLWRAFMRVPNGPHDVVAIEAAGANSSRQTFAA